MAGILQYTLTQSLLDIIFSILILITIFSETFQFMSDYSIGILFISYSFETKESLKAYVRASYPDFQKYFCKTQPNLAHLSPVCDNFSSFQFSSSIFLFFLSLCLSLVLYSQLYLMGRVFKSKRPFFQFAYGHFAYPLIYILAVFSYIGTSQVLSIHHSSSDCQNGKCDVLYLKGFYCMIGGVFVALSSLCWFWATKGKIAKILFPPDISK